MSGTPEQRAETESRPVVLRVLVESASRSHSLDVVRYLADVNGAETEPIGQVGSRMLATWLTFQAGWYEQSPLRFEVIAATGRLDTPARRALLDLVDAVVFVASCSRRGLPAARRHLGGSGLVANDVKPGGSGLVIFGHRRPSADEVTTEEVLQALALPADTAIVLTGPEGSGVRYGFALAARQGLNRIRERDAQGIPRREPATSEMVRSIVAPATEDAGDLDADRTPGATANGTAAEQPSRPVTPLVSNGETSIAPSPTEAASASARRVESTAERSDVPIEVPPPVTGAAGAEPALAASRQERIDWSRSVAESDQQPTSTATASNGTAPTASSTETTPLPPPASTVASAPIPSPEPSAPRHPVRSGPPPKPPTAPSEVRPPLSPRSVPVVVPDKLQLSSIVEGPDDQVERSADARSARSPAEPSPILAAVVVAALLLVIVLFLVIR